MDYDALIVGGGPAGSCAARSLALSGARVAVLDQARFPRPKPCGGCVRMKALDRFPWLGAALAKIPTSSVSKVVVEAPGGTSVRTERAEPLFFLARRWDLDHALLLEARAAGAEVREGFRALSVRRTPEGVEVRGEGGRTVLGRLLIGADGVNGVCARSLGLQFPRSDMGFALMEESGPESLRPSSDDTLHVFFGHEGSMGYGYLFPKQGGVSVGSGRRLDRPGQGTASPYERHLRFVDSLVRKGLLSGRSRREDFKGWLVPYGRPPRKTYADRGLVCGDSAGMVNALTGEGIYYAMASGELAARTAEAALREGDLGEASLARYEALWRAEFGVELEQAARIQEAFRRDLGRIDTVVGAASRDGALSSYLADYLCGRADYSSAKTFLALRFLPVYLRFKLDGALARLPGRRRP